MQAVADRVGVRSPSLYKHVRDRRELVALVVGATLDDLATRLVDTESEPDPRQRLVAQATALRRFAHEHPTGFSLVFAVHDSPRAEPETAARAVAPVLDAVAELVGPEHALEFQTTASNAVLGASDGVLRDFNSQYGPAVAARAVYGLGGWDRVTFRAEYVSLLACVAVVSCIVGLAILAARTKAPSIAARRDFIGLMLVFSSVPFWLMVMTRPSSDSEEAKPRPGGRATPVKTRLPTPLMP